MVNKKGYIRTIESVLAVLIILGVLIYLNTKNVKQETKVPAIVESSQKLVLATLSNDLALRYCIILGRDSSTNPSNPNDYSLMSNFNGLCNSLNFVISDIKIPPSIDRTRVQGFTTSGIIDCGSAINKLIQDNLPSTLSYTCEVCEQTLSCLSTDESSSIPIDKNVYTRTIFLALTDKNINAKVIRLYYWRK